VIAIVAALRASNEATFSSYIPWSALPAVF